jgi:hypothetical protein
VDEAGEESESMKEESEAAEAQHSTELTISFRKYKAGEGGTQMAR